MDTSQRASRAAYRLVVVVVVLCCLTEVNGRQVERIPRAARHTPALRHTRIVGGNVTSQGQFPSVVALYHHSLFGKSFICGGTLLNTNHVLTAAQCLDGYSASSLEVVAGEQDLGHTSGLEQSHRGALKVTHDFTSTTGANDIAILRTSGHFMLAEGLVEMVPLPRDYQTPPAMCTAVGWGYTQYGGSISKDLRAVELPTLTDQECTDVYGPDQVMLDMMCAGYMGGGSGVCNGDAGGPLFCEGVMMGITSRGLHCDNYPAIFTEVSHYLDWIRLNSDA
ncbi:trypsin-1-like [Scylla paramamosain]|uniref:trypsin-1-like n=1 Tax=Scylla paramamosain TaxID=85552 RepID=UPI0030828B30